MKKTIYIYSVKSFALYFLAIKKNDGMFLKMRDLSQMPLVSNVN